MDRTLIPLPVRADVALPAAGPDPARPDSASNGRKPPGTVIGNLFRQSGSCPAAGIMVTLCSPVLGRSYPVYSDRSGSFALFNIPPGAYTLEVWLGPAQPAIRMAVVVAAGAQSRVGPLALP
jgi:hypothetical protein